MSIRFDQEKSEVFDTILPVIARFKKEFGRDLSTDFIAELYAARELNLELPDRSNEPGSDAKDDSGQRYEIKYRNTRTINVDLNGFDFDYLILVNLSEDYYLVGMWRTPVDRAKSIFTFRKNFRKYQATQEKVKCESIRIR